MRSTRHGPVLSDVSDELASIAAPGKAIALAFTGLTDRDTTMDAVMRIDGARNWDEFLAALRLVVAPTQNIVYADVTGDIGFISPGLVPLRKSGDGLAPVDGASGAYDWVGTIPFDELPQLHNPDAGFAFNANNANVADDHQPTFGQDWEEAFRARRIQQFFDTIDKHSLETSAAMQGDILSLAAKALQPFIARIAPSDERARQAQAMLMNWNATMDKDRPEPLIFTAFMGVAPPPPDGGQDRARHERPGPVRGDDADFADDRPPLLVRRAGKARSGLQADARPGARRRPRPHRQARRRRHEPVALGT